MVTSPITQPSLLIRLRDTDDHESWSVFIDIYAPLVHRFLCNRGLQHADALDLTQEVMATVAANIKSFKYDPERGKFRLWLFTTVQNRLRDFWRRGKHQVHGVGDTQAIQDLMQQPSQQNGDVDEWNQEYQRQLFYAAAKQVRGNFQESTWQAFWQTAVQGDSGGEVAERLGMTRAAVYLAKGRVIARIKEQVCLLQGEPS